MNETTVLTFGVISEITGNSRLTVTDVSSTEDLRMKLEEQFPGLKSINYAVAVNKKIVSGPSPLPDRATIALLPPFSGG
jgi:sulfur-carrier protein